MVNSSSWTSTCELHENLTEKHQFKVFRNTKLLSYAVIILTSCPARHCSGICAPLNFVALLLWLRSASSFPDQSLKRLPIDYSIEKLCSALNFCFLQKRPFSNGKIHTLLVTSSPGGSLFFCFSRSSLCRAKTCFFTSPCSPCLSFQPQWVTDGLVIFSTEEKARIFSSLSTLSAV